MSIEKEQNTNIEKNKLLIDNLTLKNLIESKEFWSVQVKMHFERLTKMKSMDCPKVLVDNEELQYNQSKDNLKLCLFGIKAYQLGYESGKSHYEYNKLIKELLNDEEIQKKEILGSDISKNLEDLDFLTIRILNCLKRANINTLDELLNLTEDDLLKIKSLGNKSRKLLIEELKKRGYEIRKD